MQKKTKPKPCKFNTQCKVHHNGVTFDRCVDCDEQTNCATCGWNPEVDAQRKKDIRLALHPVVKTWVIGRGTFDTIEWKKHS